MSGVNSEVKVLIARNKKKRRSGFVVEESDDGRYYLTKIPSDCRDVKIGDQIREINGIRWLDIEDEDHANELLDDPAVQYISLSVISKQGSHGGHDDDDDDDDDDDVDIQNGDTEDEDDSVVSDGSDSEDVSISTDDEDNVVRKSASFRPSQSMKSVQQRRSTASEVHVSDASDDDDDDDDDDVEHYNYAQGTSKQSDSRPSRQSTNTRKDNDKGRVSDVKQNARGVSDPSESFNAEKADKAKEAERERARAIKQRREQEKLEAAAERRRKDELAQQLKEAEAHGKKIQRAKVTVERNIGAYSVGSTAKKSLTASSSSKKPTSNSGGGWSKVASAPKPSSGGWNKVTINTKK